MPETDLQLVDLDPDILQAYRQKAREDLYFFAKGILGYDWLTDHIHLAVCQSLEDLSSNRKLFVLPRGWLKSTICSIAFPIWLSIQDKSHKYHGPNVRILLVQNTATNAVKKLAVISEQWTKNHLLRLLFPELLPSRSSTWRADSLCLTRSGSFAESTYEAAGASTQVTSRHYDVIIEDDTVAPDLDELGNEALAPTSDDVQKAIGWHRTNVMPLLNNPADDLVLVVGTRWYDQDLIRWVMDNEPDYVVVSRACREDENGKPDMKGRITYPERFNEKVLAQLLITMGPYMFYCLYQNTPVRSEDMAFKPQWFVYYDIPPRPNELAVYTSVDLATDPSLSKEGDVDYNVVMTCGKDMDSGLIYVLDYFRQRCNPGTLIAAIFDHVQRYRPLIVGYENAAYQRSIDYWVKESMRKQNLFFNFESLNLSRAKDAKELRIGGLQPLFAAGAILIKPWMKELVSELLKFPLGDYDDTADALSMQTVLWRLTRAKQEGLYLQSAPDPFDVDAALEDILRRKNGGRNDSLIFAPVRTARQNPLFFTGFAG